MLRGRVEESVEERMKRQSIEGNTEEAKEEGDRRVGGAIISCWGHLSNHLGRKYVIVLAATTHHSPPRPPPRPPPRL